PLEGTIAAKGQGHAFVALVREQFASSPVFALGQPAGDTSIPERSSESDLLFFTVNDKNGTEQVMLPVFTRAEIMRDALLHNPDWQGQSILQIDGGALLGNVAPGVIIVINPWSPLEFQLPARGS